MTVYHAILCGGPSDGEWVDTASRLVIVPTQPLPRLRTVDGPPVYSYDAIETYHYDIQQISMFDRTLYVGVNHFEHHDWQRVVARTILQRDVFATLFN